MGFKALSITSHTVNKQTQRGQSPCQKISLSSNGIRTRIIPINMLELRADAAQLLRDSTGGTTDVIHCLLESELPRKLPDYCNTVWTTSANYFTAPTTKLCTTKFDTQMEVAGNPSDLLFSAVVLTKARTHCLRV